MPVKMVLRVSVERQEVLEAESVLQRDEVDVGGDDVAEAPRHAREGHRGHRAARRVIRHALNHNISHSFHIDHDIINTPSPRLSSSVREEHSNLLWLVLKALTIKLHIIIV